MVEKRILIVGEVSEVGAEMLETALALGLEPIVVLAPGQRKLTDTETWYLSELPDSYRELPATLARSGLLPDSVNLRLDRALYNRVSGHIALAEQHGITNWVSLIHPSSVVSPSAHIGRGVYIGPLVTISAKTRVGDFARVGRSSSIGHDVTIGTFARIGPAVAISGNTVIGAQTMVGTGAVFLNRLTIGERSLVGAGSVVTKSFPADSKLWGNPAIERS